MLNLVPRRADGGGVFDYYVDFPYVGVFEEHLHDEDMVHPLLHLLHTLIQMSIALVCVFVCIGVALCIVKYLENSKS